MRPPDPDEERLTWLVGWQDEHGAHLQAASSEAQAYAYAQQLKQWWPERKVGVLRSHVHVWLIPQPSPDPRPGTPAVFTELWPGVALTATPDAHDETRLSFVPDEGDP